MHCSHFQSVVHTLSECSPLVLNLKCNAVPCEMEPCDSHLISWSDFRYEFFNSARTSQSLMTQDIVLSWHLSQVLLMTIPIFSMCLSSATVLQSLVTSLSWFLFNSNGSPVLLVKGSLRNIFACYFSRSGLPPSHTFPINQVHNSSPRDCFQDAVGHLNSYKCMLSSCFCHLMSDFIAQYKSITFHPDELQLVWHLLWALPVLCLW